MQYFLKSLYILCFVWLVHVLHFHWSQLFHHLIFLCTAEFFSFIPVSLCSVFKKDELLPIEVSWHQSQGASWMTGWMIDMDRWMDGWLDEDHIDGWMDDWVYGWLVGEWLGGWLDRWTGGWLDTDGWMDEWDDWMDGWMDGWMKMDGWMIDRWVDEWMRLDRWMDDWRMDVLLAGWLYWTMDDWMVG